MAKNIKIKDLVYPYFVIAGRNKKQKIKSFPGIFRFSLDKLLKDIQKIRQLGLNKILLFGIDARKDYLGSQAYAANSIVAEAVKKIKAEFPDLVVMTDVCLCAYTSHGHCGVIKLPSQSEAQRSLPSRGKVTKAPVERDNRKTIEAMAEMTLVHAQAGAAWVAP